MRLTHPVFVCLVSVLGIALISHLRAQDPGHNSGKATNPPHGPVAVAARAAGQKPGSAPLARLPDSYGKIPLSFEANKGQTDSRVRFVARGGGYSVYLTSSEVLLSLHRFHQGAVKPDALESPRQRRADLAAMAKNADWATVRMRLIGSNPDAQSNGFDLLPGKVNYLIGKDPRKWHTDVPTYAKVRLSQVYPGVDMVYYGNQEGHLEHDFVVAPKADPSQIEFDMRDQDRAPTFTGGELRLATKAGEVKLRAPFAYQIIGGQRKQVEAAYEDAGSGHIRFRLGSYDDQQPLVIDPVLVYSAVFGGSQGANVVAMAVDAKGNVYVTGPTFSSDFPLVDAIQSAPGDIGPGVATATFISKLNPSGTALLYSTYLGGAGTFPEGIAVDSSGRIYVCGSASSIPVVNAYQPTFGGGFGDAFVSVLTPAGNALEWSTYLGGPELDNASAMALDSSGNVYVSGTTRGDFPALHSDYPQGTPGAFVAKFSSAGALEYSSIVNENSAASINAMATDSNGSAYLAGNTENPVTTPGAFRSTCGTQQECAWVAKVSPIGDSLIYSTTLGAAPLGATGIAVDSDLNAYVGGETGSGLTVWSTGFQRIYGGGGDGFVVKLNATGSNLIWSTYLGGSGYDVVTGLALDRYRQVYVSGYTCSPNFPLKAPIHTFAGCPGGNPQAFVTTLSSSLSSIGYFSTYFGGAGTYDTEIAVDPALNVYVAGNDGGSVPPTPGAYTAGSGIFISKLVIMDDVAVALSATPTPVAHGSNLTYTIVVTSKGPDFGVNLRATDTLPAGTTFVSYSAGGGTCTAPAVGGTGYLYCTLGQLNAGATWTVQLTVKVAAASGTVLSDNATAASNMQDFVPANNSANITTKVD